jgi:hypothetical protein
MISSRTLLLSLIALNLLALAWWSGAMSPLSDSVKEPQRLEGQIEPQRLKLVSAEPPTNAISDASAGASTTSTTSTTNDELLDAAPPVQTGQPTAPSTPDQDLVGIFALPFADKDEPPALIALDPSASDSAAFKVPTSLSAEVIAAPDATAAQQWQEKSQSNSSGLPMVAAAISGESKNVIGENSKACMRFNGMSYIEAREVEDDLLPLGATVELERADTGSFLVYIDPLPTEQLASRKQSQLRSIGVTDLQVIRSGYYRNGISLGLLRSLPLARKHQTELAALGVSSMRIGPVNVASARYDMVVFSQSPDMAKKIKNHEVLSAMTAADCDR